MFTGVAEVIEKGPVKIRASANVRRRNHLARI
jgi:hypothetical protein